MHKRGKGNFLKNHLRDTIKTDENFPVTQEDERIPCSQAETQKSSNKVTIENQGEEINVLV